VAGNYEKVAMTVDDRLAHARAMRAFHQANKKLGSGVVKKRKLSSGAGVPQRPAQVSPAAAAAVQEAPSRAAAAAVQEAPSRLVANKPRIDADRMPGGKRCCGGGLTFEQLRLPDGRVPFFPMPPSALAIFRGVELRHATCEHGPLTCRAKGHEAHISFAIQTPRDVLGVLDESRHAIHKSLVEHGALDAHKIWRDAVWLPVTIEEDQEKGGRPSGAQGTGSAGTRSSRARTQKDQSRRRSVRTCHSQTTHVSSMTPLCPTVCRADLLRRV
jgi:hypothetical protein